MKDNKLLKKIDGINLPKITPILVLKAIIIIFVAGIAGFYLLMGCSYIAIACGNEKVGILLFIYIIVVLLTGTVSRRSNAASNNILQEYGEGIENKIGMLSFAFVTIISFVIYMFVCDGMIKTIGMTIGTVLLNYAIYRLSGINLLMNKSLKLYIIMNIICYALNGAIFYFILADVIWYAVAITAFVVWAIWDIKKFINRRQPDAVVTRSDGKTSKVYLSEDIRNHFTNTGK